MLSCITMLFGAMEKVTKQFVEYVSEVSGRTVAWGPRVSARLPQYLAQQYALCEITIERRGFLGVLLKDSADFRPSVLEKHLRQIMASVTDREGSVSYTHLRAHETKANLVCRLLL